MWIELGLIGIESAGGGRLICPPGRFQPQSADYVNKRHAFDVSPHLLLLLLLLLPASLPGLLLLLLLLLSTCSLHFQSFFHVLVSCFRLQFQLGLFLSFSESRKKEIPKEIPKEIQKWRKGRRWRPLICIQICIPFAYRRWVMDESNIGCHVIDCFNHRSLDMQMRRRARRLSLNWLNNRCIGHSCHHLTSDTVGKKK